MNTIVIPRYEADETKRFYKDQLAQHCLSDKMSEEGVVQLAYIAASSIYCCMHGEYPLILSIGDARDLIEHYMGYDTFFESIADEDKQLEISLVAEACFEAHECDQIDCEVWPILNELRSNLLWDLEEDKEVIIESREHVSRPFPEESGEEVKIAIDTSYLANVRSAYAAVLLPNRNTLAWQTTLHVVFEAHNGRVYEAHDQLGEEATSLIFERGIVK